MNLNNYTESTERYISNVIDYLTKKYGEVPSEWEAILMLLGDNLDLYNECRESVRINGIYNADNGKKNPLLTTMKDLQATIIKQIQHLGLSPYAVSKIKDMGEDDTDSYIEALTNGE